MNSHRRFAWDHRDSAVCVCAPLTGLTKLMEWFTHNGTVAINSHRCTIDMSISFLKNFCGFPCSASELREVPRPKLELGISVTFKSIEAGIVVGSLAIPILQLFTGVRDAESFKRGCYKGAVAGGYFACLAGPLCAVACMRMMSDAEIYEQVFRLRSNTTQLVFDRASALSGLVGYLLFGPTGLICGVDLACLGSALSYFLFPDGEKYSQVY
uniref:Mitochondrial import inner membrane translocase subunit TIM22 n=1 Tax=Trichuris muris TaxID=70415 RepID=A0A5S6Q011_TRIMR